MEKEYSSDLTDYYMQFDNQDGDSVIQKFWIRLTQMITGPDAEYVYLRRLLHNFEVKKE